MAFANFNCRDIEQIRSTVLKVVIHPQDANGDYTAPDNDQLSKIAVFKNNTALTSPAGYSYTESALTSQGKLLTITLATAPLITDTISVIATYKFSGTDKTDRINITFVPSKEDNADQVWDEPYAQHTTAQTFGKLMDILRKSNLAVEGEVTNAITPTTTQFSTNLNYPTGAFKHAVLLFEDDVPNIALENSPILTYVNTNGVITLEEPMTAAPANGDKFLIVANSHVHSIAAIADGIWDEALSGHTNSTTFGGKVQDIYQLVNSSEITVTQAAVGNGVVTLYRGRKYDGVAHPKVLFSVTKDYTTATINFYIYNDDDPTVVYKAVSVGDITSTEIRVELNMNLWANNNVPVFSGTPSVFEGRYELVASFSGSEETVATGPCYIYDTETYSGIVSIGG